MTFRDGEFSRTSWQVTSIKLNEIWVTGSLQKNLPKITCLSHLDVKSEMKVWEASPVLPPASELTLSLPGLFLTLDSAEPTGHTLMHRPGYKWSKNVR